MMRIFILVLLIISFLFIAEGKEFSISSPIIKVVIEQGGKISSPVSIINHAEKQEFSVSYSSSEDFLFVDKDNFVLEKDSGETVNVILNSKNYDPGVFVGNIVVNGERESFIIPVIFEIESGNLLFDVSSETASAYSKLNAGERLIVEIGVYNLRSDENDAILEYKIMDLNGEEIISEVQEIEVKKRTRFIKTFPIPADIGLGEYVFSVSVRDKEFISVGTSSFIFSISEPVLFSPVEEVDYYFFIVSGIVVILIIMFVLFNHYWNRKLRTSSNEWEEKLADIKRVKFSDVGREVRKLEYKKKVLKKAHEEGYVSNSSFAEGRKNINISIMELKKRL